jgi:hypothetical protein
VVEFSTDIKSSLAVGPHPEINVQSVVLDLIAKRLDRRVEVV